MPNSPLHRIIVRLTGADALAEGVTATAGVVSSAASGT